ncbi:MAG: hypothetical protein LBH24_00545 [Clostridiales bacterium]|nr:hypothetical protein [Clostridiales bacterium]
MDYKKILPRISLFFGISLLVASIILHIVGATTENSLLRMTAYILYILSALGTVLANLFKLIFRKKADKVNEDDRQAVDNMEK